MKRCQECGAVADSLYEGSFCSKCYEEIWDAGFSVTTEWGEKIAHDDFVNDLNDQINNNDPAFRETASKIITDFEPALWYCWKCGSDILTLDEQSTMNLEEQINRLVLPCSECKSRGTLGHDFKPA